MIRWLTQHGHQHAQEKGRNEILEDYHLRVGEVFAPDEGEANGVKPLLRPRLDQTEAGEGESGQPGECVSMKPLNSGNGNSATRDVNEVLEALAFDPTRPGGFVSWDFFEAILLPGQILLLCAWVDQASAERFGRALPAPAAGRLRHIQVLRDYGMFDY